MSCMGGQRLPKNLSAFRPEIKAVGLTGYLTLYEEKHVRRKMWLLLALLLVACTIPQDPENTTELVRDRVLRVGVTENSPWVVRNGETPSGVEVELVRTFAERMNADVEWHWGIPDENLEALTRYELHLVIGGLTQASPWRREVADCRRCPTGLQGHRRPRGKGLGRAPSRGNRSDLITPGEQSCCRPGGFAD